MLIIRIAVSRTASTRALNSGLFLSGAVSSRVVTLARKNGSVCMYSPTSIFSRPERITVRLPFGISRILRIRAAVPMRYISSGVGVSISGLRCNTAAKSPSLAFTARTRAMLFSRPTVIGVTAPGKRTELRSVKIGRISGRFTSSMVSSSPETMGIAWNLRSASSAGKPLSSKIISSFFAIVI